MICTSQKLLGSDFGRTDFSRIFIFEPLDFFSRILSPDYFSSFSWGKVPRKSSKKIPSKILQNLYDKNPRQLSAEGPGQKLKINYFRSTDGIKHAPIGGPPFRITFGHLIAWRVATPVGAERSQIGQIAPK